MEAPTIIPTRVTPTTETSVSPHSTELAGLARLRIPPVDEYARDPFEDTMGLDDDADEEIPRIPRGIASCTGGPRTPKATSLA